MNAIYNAYTLLLPEWKRYLENAKSPQEVILRINQTSSFATPKIIALAKAILDLKEPHTNKPLVRHEYPLFFLINFIVTKHFLKPSFPEGSKEDQALKKVVTCFEALFKTPLGKTTAEQQSKASRKTNTPPPEIPNLPETGFGLPNGNKYQMCWMNSIFQMIAHSPSHFYDRLLSADIYDEQSEEELGAFYELQIASNECVDALRANKKRSLEDQIICAKAFEKAFSFFEAHSHLPHGITHDAFEVLSRLLLRIDAELPEIKMNTDWRLSDKTVYTLPKTEATTSLKLSVSSKGKWIQQLLNDEFASTPETNLERLVLRDKDNKIIDMFSTNYKFNDFKKELGTKVFSASSTEKKAEIKQNIINARIEKKLPSVSREQLRAYAGSIAIKHYFSPPVSANNLTILNTAWAKFCKEMSIKPDDKEEYIAFARNWLGDIVLPKMTEETLRNYRRQIVLQHTPTIATVSDNDIIFALGEIAFQALSKETIAQMQKEALTTEFPAATSITTVAVESKQKTIEQLPDHIQIALYRPLDDAQVVHITEHIDLGQYMHTPQKAIYRLDQIFIHTGDNAKGTGGHYYCYIRKGDYWICYDDPHVTTFSSFTKIQQTVNRFGYAGVWSKEVNVETTKA